MKLVFVFSSRVGLYFASLIFQNECKFLLLGNMIEMCRVMRVVGFIVLVLGLRGSLGEYYEPW